MKQRQYGDDVSVEHIDVVEKREKLTALKGPSIADAFRSGKIDAEKLKMIVNLLQINGMSKQALLEIPYSQVENLWGETYDKDSQS